MSTNQTSVPTGVSGLDEILRGGFPPNHVYLLEGDPGAGKTTLGLQFLLEGVRRGEKVLYLTLLHERRTLDEMAVSHGWDLAGVEIISLVSASEAESSMAGQTVLPSSEVQLSSVMDAIKEAVDRIKPSRVFFDSIDQLRLLAGDAVIYRQKVLALQWLLETRNTTAIFADMIRVIPEFKTLAHGAIILDTVMRAYGEIHRRIHVEKMRNVPFVGGYHSFRIQTGGLEVYPRLPHTSKVVQLEWSFALSGINELDAMLGGGLAFGTSCLIAGQTGTGKTSLATAFAYAAAKRGENSSIFLFDERIDTFLKRAQGLGMDVSPLMEQGLIRVQRVDIGDMSGGEFAQRMRDEVEQHNAKVVILDSLTGYASVMPDEPQLIGQLHDTMTYLDQHGVMSLITTSEHGIVGTQSPLVDASYIADAVVLIRRFEAMGTVRIAVSVIKKRYSGHEKSIRELQITPQGIVVGQPLTEFQGVLTGEPTFVGERRELIEQKHAE
jgi:circadian clock protein KaiC